MIASPGRRRPTAAPAPALLVVSLGLAGCAIPLRAPTPDGLRPRAAPSTRPGAIAVAATLDSAAVGALADDAAAASARFGQQADGLGGWSLQVTREGPAEVVADGDRICIGLPLRGDGMIAVLGQRLERSLRATVRVCARPRMRPDALLVLEDAAVAVVPAGERVELSSRVLTDALRRHAGTTFADAVRERIGRIAIDIGRPLAQALASLREPMAIPGRGCLLLRPARLRVGQPVMEGGGIRVPAQLEVTPSVVLPCPAAASAPPRPLQVLGDPDLRAEKVELSIPVAVDVRQLGPRIAEALARQAEIKVDGGGTVRLGAVAVATAGDALLIRIAAAGVVRDRLLGLVPWQREVRGEVLLWGRPSLRGDVVVLEGLDVDLQGDDRVARIAMALKRSEVRAIVARHATIPIAPMVNQARQDIAGLEIRFAGDRMQARVHEPALVATGARALPGWLVVDVQFRGHIVISTAVATPAAASAAPTQPHATPPRQRSGGRPPATSSPSR